MLAHIGMPVQVVDDVVAATLRLRLGAQLLLNVGVPVQVRLHGLGRRLAHGGIALLRGSALATGNAITVAASGTQQAPGEPRRS